MRAIYKYELKPGITQLALPKDAQPLCIATQRDAVQLWALINTDHVVCQREFLSVGTGHEIQKDLRLEYIGTAHALQGWMVWHVFEVIKQ